MKINMINDPSVPPNHFKCAKCERVFKRSDDWTHEGAKAEHDKNFPGTSLDDAVSVCDDCYAEIGLAMKDQQPPKIIVTFISSL